MKGILIDLNSNEFIAVVRDVEKFIKVIRNMDGDVWKKLPDDKQEKIWKESYKMIKDLDDRIDEIDIYNKCSVCVSKWTSKKPYKDDLFDICIYGDDGMLHFEIHTNPKTI